MDNRPSILIVDDLFHNRSILARRFARSGFQTAEAETGERALELIDDQNFALVLLDVTMPGLDGLQVLKRIRQKFDPLTLPVIMVTARTEGADIAEALKAGANDYVTKPVDFTVALARVAAQLERKKAKDAVDGANDALSAMNQALEKRIAERTAELTKANDELKKQIAEREHSQAESHYLAHHDVLTGLANRVMLGQHLEEALATRRNDRGEIAVLFVDLDGFKSINDSLGHSTGDALLKCVARRLEQSVRDTDKIARLGGDEFAIVQIEKGQPTVAATLASRIIGVIGSPYKIDGNELSIGASIGIATASETKNSPEDLLKNADLAMYDAKADGRGTYRFFEPEMEVRAQARRLMEASLRTANIDNAFEVYYQPLFDLQKKEVTCLEALLRWHHPDKGFVPPADFIPLAEEIGMIATLGEWVLRQACLTATNWPENIRIAVNLSPIQFKYAGLPHAVRKALTVSGLSPSRLELEITESVLLERTEANLKILHELRGLGVTISLDDFGTGYSSLSYLRAFRFDKIKIDRAFIGDLTKTSDSMAIVRAIAELGRNLGIITAAEGVEKLEQLRLVEAEGCRQVQGYLLSPPLPAADIPAVIRRLQGADYWAPLQTGDHRLRRKYLRRA